MALVYDGPIVALLIDDGGPGNGILPNFIDDIATFATFLSYVPISVNTSMSGYMNVGDTTTMYTFTNNDGEGGGHNGGGTKPAVTFEDFSEVEGNISFKVVLNDHNVPNLDYIKILGNFNGTSSDLTYTSLQSSLNPGAFLTDDGDINIYGNGAFHACLTGDGPHELLTISAPASFFGTPFDGERSRCNF